MKATVRTMLHVCADSEVKWTTAPHAVSIEGTLPTSVKTCQTQQAGAPWGWILHAEYTVRCPQGAQVSPKNPLITSPCVNVDAVLWNRKGHPDSLSSGMTLKMSKIVHKHFQGEVWAQSSDIKPSTYKVFSIKKLSPFFCSHLKFLLLMRRASQGKGQPG